MLFVKHLEKTAPACSQAALFLLNPQYKKSPPALRWRALGGARPQFGVYALLFDYAGLGNYGATGNLLKGIYTGVQVGKVHFVTLGTEGRRRQ